MKWVSEIQLQEDDYLASTSAVVSHPARQMINGEMKWTARA